ncbi:MAG: DUF4845 domain-containing protein [Gammaproteobacteria bacterium]|nr:DUF4845 domain-containing protein [Gammaproteobacteria bacterium]MDE2252126.1 DUF4845 domain-containing protein [Gammaproteobacteria bacterium]
MPKTQRGVTLIGWVILLLPVGLIGYAGILLTPKYLNYFNVVKAMNQEADEDKDNPQVDPKLVRAGLSRRFDVEYIDKPTPNDIDVHRDGDHWVMVADYEELVPLFGNVSILVQFNKQVRLQ